MAVSVTQRFSSLEAEIRFRRIRTHALEMVVASRRRDPPFAVARED